MEISALLSCNSLDPAEGALYVCVPSADGQHDGHDWADEASELGAVAVLAQRPLPDALLPVVVVPDTLRALGEVASAFYDRPSRRMRTVGVAGSLGKTTTAWLARGMFEETNERCGMIGARAGTRVMPGLDERCQRRRARAGRHVSCPRPPHPPPHHCSWLPTHPPTCTPTHPCRHN